MSLHPLLPEILGHRDFTRLARVTNEDLGSGSRAMVLPDRAALKALLPHKPDRAVRSARYARVTLMSMVALSVTLALFGSADGSSDALLVMAGILMMLVVVGLPVSLGRVWYLSRKDRELPQPDLDLPVVINDTRDPSELALLHQLCAFHDYTHQSGYPIPTATWHALVRDAQHALHSGNLAAAQRVSTQIDEWVAGAEAAETARRYFR
ncbi:hypothetical protein HMPREF0290_2618 [Corynebacterium efficiens YS-314]|uniref:Uncharacterized protein n=1 Tax=Corynebacterium efficiens (strain DSM 44549 / YS-314 / AJ 12310 / JCM 11189 / NBRC 100395) TaxID=196164 RepID=Q8FUA8_COREF|nr:hypothetical protein [Corynebacterium efficiens]EEW48841.1 hypothetical protein HMPREF0290_2618 [Corynebacterium efficiens YS-314]BAC16923.1 hypothetical protein [Corynebacterium efficiens YS-314]